MQKEVVLGSALVLFGLVVFAGSFILISNSKSLTGKVISEDGFAVGGDEAASSGSNTLAGISTVCSSGCNPDNSLEICSSGNWMRCPSGDVCSLGQCIRPIENSAETRLVVGGTGSSSGGSSGSSSSDAAVAPETINQIGEIDGTTIQEIGNGEKIIFLSDGNVHSLKVASLGITEAILETETGSSIGVSLGESEFIDYNSDSDNDIEIILKGVGLGSKKAKVLLNEV